VREITGAGEEEALDALESSGWVVREACEGLGGRSEGIDRSSEVGA
jgi:hypothetical protein